jgi:hypothetical protein
MREQQNNKHDRTTIGLDLGDRWHRFCVLGASGQVVEEGSVANNRVALSELSSRYPGALIVMEAGCHSPWASRHLEQAGCEVIVSNPRKTWAISARTQERSARCAYAGPHGSLYRDGCLAVLAPDSVCFYVRPRSLLYENDF